MSNREMFEDRHEPDASWDAARRRAWIYWVITKCLNVANEELDFFELKVAMFNWVIRALGTVTPRELIAVFPPTKTYDGERFGCKDYFSTMEAVAEHGIDEPLGDGVFEFFWDYMNPHISDFVVRYLSAISEARKSEGKSGLIEEFFHNQGIATYTRLTMPDGREVLKNNKTGEIASVAKPKPKMPRWWKVIEGGARV